MYGSHFCSKFIHVWFSWFSYGSHGSQFCSDPVFYTHMLCVLIYTPIFKYILLALNSRVYICDLKCTNTEVFYCPNFYLNDVEKLDLNPV